MFVLKQWRWLSIYVGRDACRDLDMHVFVGIGRRTDHGRGAMSTWPLTFQASWNWRPTVYTVPADGWRFAGPGFADSAEWTGRDRRVIGWSWPAFSRFAVH